MTQITSNNTIQWKPRTSINEHTLCQHANECNWFQWVYDHCRALIEGRMLPWRKEAFSYNTTCEEIANSTRNTYNDSAVGKVHTECKV